MLRLKTTASTFTGRAELVMPNGKVAFLWYRLERQGKTNGFNATLRGKPRVIDHAQHQATISLQLMPKVQLFFKCVQRKKSPPQLIYLGTNPPKKRRR
jgi:hypothetical protein